MRISSEFSCSWACAYFPTPIQCCIRSLWACVKYDIWGDRTRDLLVIGRALILLSNGYYDGFFFDIFWGTFQRAFLLSSRWGIHKQVAGGRLRPWDTRPNARVSFKRYGMHACTPPQTKMGAVGATPSESEDEPFRLEGPLALGRLPVWGKIFLKKLKFWEEILANCRWFCMYFYSNWYVSSYN